MYEDKSPFHFNLCHTSTPPVHKDLSSRYKFHQRRGRDTLHSNPVMISLSVLVAERINFIISPGDYISPISTSLPDNSYVFYFRKQELEGLFFGLSDHHPIINSLELFRRAMPIVDSFVLFLFRRAIPRVFHTNFPKHNC